MNEWWKICCTSSSSLLRLLLAETWPKGSDEEWERKIEKQTFFAHFSQSSLPLKTVKKLHAVQQQQHCLHTQENEEKMRKWMKNRKNENEQTLMLVFTSKHFFMLLVCTQKFFLHNTSMILKSSRRQANERRIQIAIQQSSGRFIERKKKKRTFMAVDCLLDVNIDLKSRKITEKNEQWKCGSKHTKFHSTFTGCCVDGCGVLRIVQLSDNSKKNSFSQRRWCDIHGEEEVVMIKI